MAKIDPYIEGLLKQHGLGKEAVWDCHGTWVMLHRYCEHIARGLSITFLPPEIIHSDAGKKECVVVVTAKMGQQTEWSFGEAMPYNNKNPYPFAMAEKRAKDRVILKLAGMSGHIYSEEEADDFRASRPEKAVVAQAITAPTVVAKQEKQGDPPHILAIIEEFQEDLDGLEKLLKIKGYVKKRWTELDEKVAATVLENADWARGEIQKLKLAA